MLLDSKISRTESQQYNDIQERCFYFQKGTWQIVISPAQVCQHGFIRFESQICIPYIWILALYTTVKYQSYRFLLERQLLNM